MGFTVADSAGFQKPGMECTLSVNIQGTMEEAHSQQSQSNGQSSVSIASYSQRGFERSGHQH